MITINKNQIFFKIAARALFTGLEYIPIAGAIVKISYDCWKVLKEHQESMAVQERIAQLEEAAALSPDEARQAADAAFEELKQEGQKVPADRAAAVRDLISVMPAAIREKTKATLQHARKHGTAAATVLPVTSHFKDADREEFYTGLFPQRRPQFKPGDAVPNYNPDWKLERLIGAGGFGEVWLARNQSIKGKTPVAIKFCQDPAHAKLMKHEANNLATLTEKLPFGTPHIVGLIDAHLTNQPYWLMFEYIDGGTLEHRMRLGAMDWATAWQLFEPILQGVSQVHEQGIVHRDLKPANILLADGIDPRIADFGIGKIVAERSADEQRTSRTFTTTGYGTANYMSPEQVEGAPAHPSDDVYALGIILYQMLAGHQKPLKFPYEIQQLSAPSSVTNIISDCVFLPRTNRLSSGRKLLAELRSEAVEHITKPVERKPVTTPEATSKQVLQPPVTKPKELNEIQKRLAEKKKEQERKELLLQQKQELNAKRLTEQQAKQRMKMVSIIIGSIFGLSLLGLIDKYIEKLPSNLHQKIPSVQSNIVNNIPLNNNKINVTQLNNISSDNNATDTKIDDQVNYTDNGDGTITDPITGLMWQRCLVGQDWSGFDCRGKASSLPFKYIMPNNNPRTWDVFAGYNDWRVPSHGELLTSIDINQTAFPNTTTSTVSPWFWSASFSENRPDYTWIVNIYDRKSDGYVRNRKNHVRLVRERKLLVKESESVQKIAVVEDTKLSLNLNETLLIDQQKTIKQQIKKSNERYIINGDGTVIDTHTNLMWQACSVGQDWSQFDCKKNIDTITWSYAMEYEGGYWPDFAGYKNWRLPTKEELQTLIYCSSGKPKTWNDTDEYCDGKYKQPTIDTVAFPNTCPVSKYWSSTRHNNDIKQSWYANFGEGIMFYGNQEYNGAVRLVRKANP